MKLKDDKNNSSKIQKYLSNFNNLKHKDYLLLAVMSVCILLIFCFGVIITFEQIYNFDNDEEHYDFYLTGENILYLLSININGDAPPQKLTINIKNNDFQKIAYKREVALQLGVLFASDEDYVPATITIGDKTVNVKLRLKGDWTDHLESDRWSFRIKVKDDETIFGMKEFSIQDPSTRNYVIEWLWDQINEEEGLMTKRYDFVDVTINGKEKGIYALEEHFDKILIENNQYREGPILKFNENFMWMSFYENKSFSSCYLSAEIDSFQTKQILSDENLFAQYIQAKDLLESARRGDLNESEVFNSEKLAKYFAISDLFGVWHGQAWHNQRFYYNPIIMKFEPIPFDGLGGFTTEKLSGFFERNYWFNNDVYFAEEYISQLERISEVSYVDNLLADNKEELDRYNKILFKDSTRLFDNSFLYTNREFIQKELNPVKCIDAYFVSLNESDLIINMGNVQILPIEIINITTGNGLEFTPKDSRIILYGYEYNNLIDHQEIMFKMPPDTSLECVDTSDLTVTYRILGHSRIRTESVIPWDVISKGFSKNDPIRMDANIDDFPFFQVNEELNDIYILSGNWIIDSNIHIPEGYTVHAGSGTTLDLRDGATILSYSALNWCGTEENPIVITSSDKTGQGIVILQTEIPSVLSYVVLDGLSVPEYSGWGLSGALTFYESDVTIDHSVFMNNRDGDDMLDLVRSKCAISDSVFFNITSDAVDDDFGKGQIVRTNFINIGNDAMDFSGTDVIVAGCRVQNTGDKGVSAGERSKVSIDNLNLLKCNVGIASKDQSEVSINNLQMSDGYIGFTVYQKKSEYGAASIIGNNIQIDSIDIPYLVEIGSVLNINGENIIRTEDDIYDEYYAGRAVIDGVL